MKTVSTLKITNLLGFVFLLLVTCNDNNSSANEIRTDCGEALYAVDGCHGFNEVRKICQGSENSELCQKIVREKLKLIASYRATYGNNKYYLQTISYKIEKSVRYLNNILAKKRKINKKFICQQKRNGTIVCLKIEKVLAFYDAELSAAIVNDLMRLEEMIEGLDSKNNVLVKCGNGWFDLQTSAETENQFYDDSSSIAKINRVCELLRAKTQSGGSAGFSGVTGIGTGKLNMSGCNNLSTTSTESGLDLMIRAAEAIRNQCGSGAQEQSLPPNIQTTFMEGGSGAAAAQQQDAKFTYDDQGNVLSVEYTDANTGEYVKIEFTDDGPVVSSSSPDGNYDVSTTPDGKTVAVDNSQQGRTDTYYVGDDGIYQGHTSELRAQHGDTQAYWKRTYDENGNLVKNEHGQFNTRTRDGFYNDGSTFLLFESGYYTKQWDKINGTWTRNYGGTLDCFDPDVCNTCNAASQEFAKAFRGCVFDGSRSYDCKNYTQNINCCSDKNSFVNPALIIPNPEGDLVCSGEINIESRKAGCEASCQLADHPDCLGTCASLDSYNFEWNILDAACIYMYSEECFDGRRPGPGLAREFPAIISRHSIIPTGFGNRNSQRVISSKSDKPD